MSNQKQPSVFGGAMIIAGTTIGAGILALPMISAGMWFSWAVLLIFVTYFFMLMSSKAILEVNLHYEPGYSFNSLVKDTLGSSWNVVNGISVMFVLYILLYAYITGGSSTVKEFSAEFFNVEIDYKISAFLFSFVLGIIVFIGARAIDRVSSVLVIFLVIFFIVVITVMLGAVDMNKLLDSNGTADGKMIFIWAAVSSYLTSFCFHNAIPSLVKYFGKEPVKINKSIFYGSLIALVSYILWLLVTHGSVSREAYKLVIAEGSDVGALLKVMGSNIQLYSWIPKILNIFAFLALTTSFLGVGLGLFDYIADLFKLTNSFKDRLVTLLITFIFPVLGGMFYPYGFVKAIAWAGLFAMVWSVLIPALMLLKVRQRNQNVGYTAFKGNMISYLLIAYGITTGVLHILVVFKFLPEFN